jgi:hypothetical protein
MAWQHPTHACGHQGERYQAYGKHDGRARQLAAIERQDCPACRKAAADKAAAEAGLPLLSGSEKQVAWAGEIRERALRLLPAEKVASIRTEALAKWWIDNRSAMGSR